MTAEKTELSQRCVWHPELGCEQCHRPWHPGDAKDRFRVCSKWRDAVVGRPRARLRKREPGRVDVRGSAWLPKASLERLATALEPCNCPMARLENQAYALRALDNWPVAENRDNGDWAVAVTTAPRIEGPIAHCVQSLKINGWNPIVFAEPGSEIVDGVETRINAQKRGAWFNWKHAAETLLATGARRLLIVQDDTIILPGTRQYLDRTPWPHGSGFISLYRSRRQTPDEQPGIREVLLSRERGEWKKTGFYWGACAWAFEAEALAAILQVSLVKNWMGIGYDKNPDRRPDEVKHIDNVIGRAAKAAGRKWYAITPSAAQHVAQYSTIMHSPTGKPLGNVGDRAASKLVKDWSTLGRSPAASDDRDYDEAMRAWSSIFGNPAFPISPGLWSDIRDLIKPRGTRILEFGSGVSTLLSRKHGAEVVSYEQDPVIAAVAGAEHRPLAKNHWYSGDIAPGPWDVILIDGPQGHGREGILPKIKDLAHGGTTILVDDVGRGPEKKLAEGIAQVLGRELSIRTEGKRSWAVISGDPRPSTCAVVIPCHDYGRFLADAIESVLNQTTKASEIVVVLDHCSDDSYEVAKRYPVEILVTNACDVHLSRRLGFRATTSDAVIFLDADDRLSPEYIERGLAAFEHGVGVVTGRVESFGYDSSTWDPKPEVVDISKQNAVTSAALVRRTAINESRCFDDMSLVGSPMQDWSSWQHIARAGWTLVSADIVHEYRRHENNATLGDHFPDTEYRRRQREAVGYRSKKVRLGFIGANIGRGGVQTMTATQIRNSRNLDWVGAWIPDGVQHEDPKPLGLPTLYKGPEGLDELAEISDVLYVWSGPIPVIQELRAKYGKPVVFGVHGQGSWAQETVASIAAHVDVLWCVSQATAKVVGPEHRDKVRVIRGGADLWTTIPDRGRVEIRSAWGIGDREKAVGFVGRLSWEKNPVTVAQAMTRLPGYKLVCCSPQAHEPEHGLHKEMTDLLGDRIVWTSSRDWAMGDIYQGLDCLLVASLEEGLPLVMLEAWAAGVPVVSTPVGIWPELEPQFGVLVEKIPASPTPDQISRAVTRVMTPNPDLRSRAREMVLYEVNAQRMALEFEHLVKDVVDGQCSSQ